MTRGGGRLPASRGPAAAPGAARRADRVAFAPTLMPSARSASARPRARASRRPVADRRSGWRTAAVLAALAATVTLWCYRGVFDHAFLDWDDWAYVVDNPSVLARRYGELLRLVVAGNFH